jgi:putative peptidoglycan lipid II flippase
MSDSMSTLAPAPPGRSATFIGTFSLAGRAVERLAQFFQIVLVASVYGAAHDADVYFAASIVPLMIGTIVGEALAASLLPPLVRQRAREDLIGLVSAGFWAALALVGALTALYVAALVPVIEWRFHGDYGRLAPWLAFTPIALALGLAAYLGAVLLQYERYVWPAFRQGIAALAGLVLTGAVLVATHDLAWVAAAVSAGYVLSLLLLVVEVRHVAGLGWLAPPHGRHLREAASVWRNLTAGVTSGLLGGQVFVLLERAFAATFGTGGIATISYGRGVAFTPNVVAQSIASGIYPAMVRAHAAEDRERLVQRFFHGLRLTLFVSTGFAALFAIYGPNLVGFLLQRGRFGAETTENVGAVLSAFAPAIVGSMLMILASRVFYSTDYFRAAVWMQACALVVYVCIALPLRALWGAPGLALAFGVAELAGGTLAVVLAARRLELEAWQVVRRGLVPGLRLGLRVALALAIFRLVVESRWIEVPVAWKGVVIVGGALAVAAFTAGKALWQSGWPESRRLKDAAWKLVLLAFRR